MHLCVLIVCGRACFCLLDGIGGLIQILAAEVDNCFGVITIISWPKMKKLQRNLILSGVFDRNKVLMEWQRDLHGKKGGWKMGRLFFSSRYCSNYVVGGGEEVKSKRAPIFGFVASLTS